MNPMELWLAVGAIAVIGAALILWIAGNVVFPRMVQRGYRRELTHDRFAAASGDQGAGSEDIVYFSAYYDVRQSDLMLAGKPPAAVYWQIGVFDGFFRQIDGGHLNQRTVTLDDQGQFRIRLTAAEGYEDNTLSCASSPRGIVIFRVLLPRESVVPPTISRVGR